jgi:hypothetical protein
LDRPHVSDGLLFDWSRAPNATSYALFCLNMGFALSSAFLTVAPDALLLLLVKTERRLEAAFGVTSYDYVEYKFIVSIGALITAALIHVLSGTLGMEVSRAIRQWSGLASLLAQPLLSAGYLAGFGFPYRWVPIEVAVITYYCTQVAMRRWRLSPWIFLLLLVAHGGFWHVVVGVNRFRPEIYAVSPVALFLSLMAVATWGAQLLSPKELPAGRGR